MDEAKEEYKETWWPLAEHFGCGFDLDSTFDLSHDHGKKGERVFSHRKRLNLIKEIKKERNEERESGPFLK